MPMPKGLRGFSLVELLTVCAVFAILLAIVMSVLSGVKTRAQTVQCGSRMRQLMPAMISYSVDHAGRLPLSVNYAASTANVTNNWWYQVAPYLGLEQILEPTWASLKAISAPDMPLGCPTRSPQDPSYFSSYKMSRAHWKKLVEIGDTIQTGQGLPISMIQDPPCSILVAEGTGHVDFNTYTTVSLASGLQYPHDNQANVLFADGHIEVVTEEELQARWSDIYEKL